MAQSYNEIQNLYTIYMIHQSPLRSYKNKDDIKTLSSFLNCPYLNEWWLASGHLYDSASKRPDVSLYIKKHQSYVIDDRAPN